MQIDTNWCEMSQINKSGQKMLQNVANCQKNVVCSKMVKNVPKCSKMFQNVLNVANWYKLMQNVTNQ